MQKSRKAAASIPISAAIFSLAHLPGNALDFFLVFVVRVCFGILYMADRNLIPSTIAHSLSNLSVFIFI
ncbi:MAG: CPBP family intramembrane glutamic endopeptidase [Spirochaetota bacterium]